MFDDLYYLSNYLKKIDAPIYCQKIISATTRMFNLIQEILYYEDHDDPVVFTGYGGVFRGLLQDLKDIDHEGHVKLNHIVR